MPRSSPATPNGLWFLNSLVTRLESQSGLTVSEHVMPFGDGPPTHLHHREDEIFHIHEGEIRFRVGDDEVIGRAGDTLVAPRGVPHVFRVESPQGARVLVVTTGEDFGGVIRDYSRPAERADLPPQQDVTPAMAEALARVTAGHNITIVGPPMDA